MRNRFFRPLLLLFGNLIENRNQVSHDRIDNHRYGTDNIVDEPRSTTDILGFAQHLGEHDKLVVAINNSVNCRHLELQRFIGLAELPDDFGRSDRIIITKSNRSSAFQAVGKLVCLGKLQKRLLDESILDNLVFDTGFLNSLRSSAILATFKP